MGKVKKQLDGAVVEGDYGEDYKGYQCDGVVREDHIHKLCVWDGIGGKFAQIATN